MNGEDGEEEPAPASFFHSNWRAAKLDRGARIGRLLPRRFASTRETVLEASARLGVAQNTIRMRIEKYGWTEADALSIRAHGRYPPRGRQLRPGARPGVKLSPLTHAELVILRCLADGFTPRQIHAGGLSKSLHALHQHMDRMRLKLDAFTTGHMIATALRFGVIA